MTKQKALEVDLDVIMNPSKILTDAYDKAGARELFAGDRYFVPAFRNEERIFVAFKTSGKKISHNLFSCYRKKVGSKEFFFAFDHLVTHDCNIRGAAAAVFSPRRDHLT